MRDRREVRTFGVALTAWAVFVLLGPAGCQGDHSKRTGDGVLEFRIVPFAPVDGSADPPPTLGQDDYNMLVKGLQDKGPDGTVELGLPYIWVPLLETADTQRLVVSSFEGKRYLLVHNADEYVIRSTDEHPWGLLDVHIDRHLSGQPMVSFQLDSVGAEQMQRVTSANINRCMAIIVDGKAYSAPCIKAVIGDRGCITGIGKKEAKRLTNILRAGMMKDE